MKHLSVILMALVWISPVFAQLANPGFEQWDGNDPVGWINWNWAFASVEPGNNAHSGQHSAHIMVNDQFTGTWIEQTFDVTDIDEQVNLTIYFAQLTEGLELAVLILTDPIDGGSIEVTEAGGGWAPVTLDWEPLYQQYNSLTVWIGLGPVDDTVVGSVLVDDVAITGVRGLSVKSSFEPIVNGCEFNGVFPNPFNSTTTVNFNLPSVTGIDLGVYDLSGRRVATIAGGLMQAGNYNLRWTPESVSSGVYIVQLTAGGYVFNTRAIYLK